MAIAGNPPLTGQLGAFNSMPGNVQYGFYPVGWAVWHGPFVCQIGPDSAGVYRTFQQGQKLALPTALAAKLASSDPYWWEVH